MIHTATARAPRRLFCLLALGALLALGSGGALAQAVISESLQNELAGMAVIEQTTVIVVFDQMEPLSANQVRLLTEAGITTGILFHSLPIAGVLATPSQVHSLAGLPGVSALWANELLEFGDDTARSLIGVDRLREDANLRVGGVPVSGRGVTVLVNDSGIDATHPDLQWRRHVVENVQALTNLHAISGLLPITYLEGTPNTDTNSGHGTHVAGTVGGTGAASRGRYQGVAPGAHLIGYGSGAVLFILDGLGGFDYAITKQFSFQHPIRVITNSWGRRGAFNHLDPIVQATYLAYRRGINVVFSAGNAGPGDDTHNPFAQAPWVISVAAGDKFGRLARFSSRGVRGYTRTLTMPDGVTWTKVNEPTITAPGVDIISARASTNLTAHGGARDLDYIPPAYLPYYTMISGTSMAAPHVAGVVALLLEADPRLQPDQVRTLLRQTATNIPGVAAWEGGAGYLNAYAAVARALGDTRYTGATVNALRSFNANAIFGESTVTPFSIFFTPVGETEEIQFEVGADVAVVSARARITNNLVALVLFDPDGVRYGSAISIPLLGETVAVSAPGKPGTWRLTVRGIGRVAGVPTDPLGLTNGTSAPGRVSGTLRFDRLGGYSGLPDIAGHPAEGFIQLGVSMRLVDALRDGYRPNRTIRREHVAEYLTMGAGVRQHFPSNRSNSFGDVSGFTAAVAEAVTARGAALKDAFHRQPGLMRAADARFRPSGTINRAEMAFSLIQGLGLGAFAPFYADIMSVPLDGQRIPIVDADQIPADLRGHVQLAVELALMHVRFELRQGPFDLRPTLVAHFDPGKEVLRGTFAVYMVRYLDAYNALVAPPPVPSGGTDATLLVGAEIDEAAPGVFALKGNYPNPVRSTTTISFSLPAAAHVRLTVYDLAGRRVAELADRHFEAGAHAVQWAPDGLASGTYIYRLDAEGQSATGRMTIIR